MLALQFSHLFTLLTVYDPQYRLSISLIYNIVSLVTPSGFISWLHLLICDLGRTSYLTVLGLSFFICKLEIIITITIPRSQSSLIETEFTIVDKILNGIMYEKQLDKILVQSRHSPFPANIIIPNTTFAKVICEKFPQNTVT